MNPPKDRDVPNPDDPRLAWRSWHLADPYTNPYEFGLIEIWREPWPKPQVVEPHKLAPEFNVANLWWRPWPLIHPRFDGP